MGRNKKTGLDYFPMDVDFFQDIKVRKLIRRQGGKAITVYALLLCLIYKRGYYIGWDSELPFIISEITGYGEAYIQEAVKSCVALGLFSRELFETDRVLTSRGIQERYLYVMESKNRLSVIQEFALIPSKKADVSSEETQVSRDKIEEIGVSSEETQVKEIKRNKKKEAAEAAEKRLAVAELPEAGTSDASAAVSAREFMKFCNDEIDAAGSAMSHMVSLRGARLGYLKARVREHGLERVKEAIRLAVRSSFLNGGGDRGTVFSIEWVLRPSNFPNVLEGKYNKDYRNGKGVKDHGGIGGSRRRGLEVDASSAEDYQTSF